MAGSCLVTSTVCSRFKVSAHQVNAVSRFVLAEEANNPESRVSACRFRRKFSGGTTIVHHDFYAMIESEIAVPGACGAQLEARTERVRRVDARAVSTPRAFASHLARASPTPRAHDEDGGAPG